MDRIKMQRANVVVRISPDEKNYYMLKGYSVVDEEGNVVEEAMSNDVGTLQIQVTKLKAEIAELKSQLKAKSTKPKKSAENVDK